MIDEKKLIEAIDEDFCDDCLPCGGSCRYAELVDIIGNQPKVGEWIPCSERLPEEYQTVITTHEDGSVIVHGYMKKHGFIYNWETDEEKRTKQGGVIAWMPLPEPYRGEEHGTDA